MPALIQFRRDTASNWTSNNPTLANGEFALETDTTKYKIGDGSTVWTSLSYGGLGSIDTALIDAKGDLIAGSADNSVAKLSVGSNGQVLVADSAQTAGMKWVSQESIVNWHEAVKLGTAAALPNSPTYSNGTSGVGATLTAGSNARLVVDGSNATTGDRVLVQDQSSALQNGLYDVTTQGTDGSAAWVLTRAVDFDGSPTGQIKSGESVYVLSGSANSGQGFVVTSTSDPHTVGTHDITFTQFTGTQAFTAGTGVAISGNTINVGTASAARIVTNADNIDLATTGVSAASYGSATATGTFTVDAYGRLSAASATTIAIPSTAVTDFTEATQDVSGAQLATNGSHTGITATYDDAGDGAIDLALVTENVEDITGAQLATNGSHTGITATYDDAGDGAIDLALVTENVQDITGAQVATNGSHTGLTAAYDDGGDGAIDLTVAATLGTHTSGNYVATVAGTSNEVEVSGSGSETAAVTIGLPNDVTIGNDLTVTADVSAVNADFSGTATVTSTDAGANWAPIVDLYRNSASPADDDDLGVIKFTGENASGTKKTYGQIAGWIEELGEDDFGGINFYIGYVGSSDYLQRTLYLDDYYLNSVNAVRIGDGSSYAAADSRSVKEYNGYWTALQSTATANRSINLPDAAGTLYINGAAITDGATATTQSASDNSTKVATTAYVDTGLNALSSNSITDADNNTKIQVEESSDENIIRFDTAGSERMTIAADGTVTITGNLTVNGTTTEISSTTITVDDKNIELGSVASPDDTTADGGGITLKGASDKTFNWVDSTDAWTSSEHIALATGKSVYIDGVIQLSKNSLAATVVLADGVIATTQSANDSSTKVATTAFVMTELGDYATLASPTLTGTPAAPTAAADTNTTQIATTAYVQTELGALSSDSISDADDDTKIEVEQSADWDEIAFTIAGSQVMKLNANTLDVTGNVTWNTPLSAQTASYTFVSTDKGKLVTMSNGSAVTCTVPPNSSVAFAVGTSIQVAQINSGQVTMVAGSGVTLRSTPGLKLRAQYSSCTCTKIATDEWLITGDLDD